MHVRLIHSHEGAALHHVWQAAVADAPHVFADGRVDAGGTQLRDWDALAAQQALPNARQTTFLLWHHGTALGWVGASCLDEGRGEVYAMWVDPSCRRSGAGARLVDSAARWLVQHGATRVLAWIGCDNPSAARFYETLGFLPTPTLAPVPGHPQTQQRLYEMDAAILTEHPHGASPSGAP